MPSRASHCSATVTDVLIDRGNQQVVHRVSANHGAEVSHWGFDQLLDKARADVHLQETLIERPDLSSGRRQAAAADDGSPGDQASRARLWTGETLAGHRPNGAARFRRGAARSPGQTRGVVALIELVSSGEVTTGSGGPRIDGRRPAARRGDLADAIRQPRPERHVRHLHPWAAPDADGAVPRSRPGMDDARTRPGAACQRRWDAHAGIAELARDYEALDRSLAKRAIRFLQVRYRVTGATAEATEPALASA